MKALLQSSPFDSDGGNLIGRDPRHVTAEEWEASGLPLLIGMRAIRAKCLDCCSGSAAEVRKCTSVRCPLWPLRMGAQPKGMAAARQNHGAKQATDLEAER
ncbi:hypothetical protein [Oceanicella actignis]|uniref:hypothetical protein n=1 Tax=Oceanicella actignis TaxID=1189325 RepID=UPI0011E88564|nr:hypothetical protein [Oceanicella actignis]TYO91461.1 hypothetical protein LY05_00314 [Oceanicella actignis]